MTYKLGSLFDGSGGFPLAGCLCGIEPKWAAEVEPYPIAVTRARFPGMKHLGDIREVHGGEIEPVDIITFGSPCQDLSVAGKRAGLKHADNGDEETTRSGLFMEAVRIIREMREATNGEYPTFALWENVPGAFSSNGGEDFRTVIEELIKIVEPSAVMPAVPKGGWPYADSYCGDGWSIAYRVFDAQYWGVPQRRRRIHLIVNFRGQCAREVLFEREGVRGYFETGRTPWQATARNAQDCTGADDREGESPEAGGGRLDAVAYSFDSLASNSMKSKNPHSGCRQVEVAKTLDTTDPNPCKNQGGLAVVEIVPYTLKIRSGCKGGGKGALIQTDKSATLATNNDQYLFQPVQNLLLDDQGGQQIAVRTDDKSPTLRAESHGNIPAVICKTYDARGNGEGETVSTITGDHENRVTDYTSVVVEHAYCTDVGFFNTFEEQSPTLLARGYKDPHLVTYPESVRYIVRRLTPTECARLQGFADRWGNIDERGSFTPEEYRFWLEVRNTHATINGKQVKDYTEKQMLTWYNKLHTDSAEYKMWGNGIALPPALYCMQGIKDALERGDEDDAGKCEEDK